MSENQPILRSSYSPISSRMHVLLRTIYKKRYDYLFISPFFILFAIFFIYPAIRSIILSFYEREGVGFYLPVGIENYIKLAQDTLFLKSIFNSIFIMVLSTIPQMILAIALAVALNITWLRFRGIWRAIYFSPIIISAVVVAVIFELIFDKQYGFINYILSLVDIGKIGWTNTESLSKISIIILVTWRWTGWNMVIVLAGLQSIPIDLYDAAKVDGAQGWELFRFITLPLLRPVLVFIAMLSTIDGLRLFAEPAILTNGGPAESSLTMVMYLYRQAFVYQNFGYASAIAVAIFVFVAVMSAIAWRFLNFNQ